MVSAYKSKFRMDCVMRSLSDCVFITLTTPDKCDLSMLRERWRIFRHDYLRRIGNPKYIMVYEPHPHGHGWHIHAVIEQRWLNLSEYRHFAKQAGFGRIHVERISKNTDMTKYLPDDSSMAQGIELMKDNFSNMTTTQTIRVMFKDLNACRG